MKTTLKANNREVTAEFFGPFDPTNWDFVKVDLGLDDEAAVVGAGKTFRSAMENAVRSFIGTPYENLRGELERDSQYYLDQLQGSDALQGTVEYKLYCVLKVQR